MLQCTKNAGAQSCTKVLFIDQDAVLNYIIPQTNSSGTPLRKGI